MSSSTAPCCFQASAKRMWEGVQLHYECVRVAGFCSKLGNLLLQDHTWNLVVRTISIHIVYFAILCSFARNCAYIVSAVHCLPGRVSLFFLFLFFTAPIYGNGDVWNPLVQITSSRLQADAQVYNAYFWIQQLQLLCYAKVVMYNVNISNPANTVQLIMSRKMLSCRTHCNWQHRALCVSASWTIQSLPWTTLSTRTWKVVWSCSDIRRVSWIRIICCPYSQSTTLCFHFGHYQLWPNWQSTERIETKSKNTACTANYHWKWRGYIT